MTDQKRIETLEGHVDALIQANLGREALIDSLFERVKALEADLADDEIGVYERLADLEAVVIGKQVPERLNQLEAAANLPNYAETLTAERLAALEARGIKVKS